MKLEINFQKLKSTIQMIEKLAGKQMSLPVLSCISIEAKKNVAVFKATNLDVGIEVSIAVKSVEDGIVAVPAHILSAFISQLVDENHIVKMETSSGNLLVSSAKSKCVIKTHSPEDFPPIPRVLDGQRLSLPASALIKGLKSVWYSSSVSSVKPELASVYIYQEGDFMVFVATDSFRLAEKKMKIPLSSRFGEVLIPFKNVSEIIRVLENIGGDIEVNVNKNLISLSTNDVYVASRVIDGVFPDYRQIIPKSYITEAVVLKQDFLNALKISNIFSDKFNQTKFIVEPKAKNFEIQTKNSDVGENSSKVDAALTGENVEINFNYKYILDCFQSIDADSVSLQLSGLNRPMVIRPVSGDQTFMYLVMPMNR